jgi:hypothetical protein
LDKKDFFNVINPATNKRDLQTLQKKEEQNPLEILTKNFSINP